MGVWSVGLERAGHRSDLASMDIQERQRVNRYELCLKPRNSRACRWTGLEKREQLRGAFLCTSGSSNPLLGEVNFVLFLALPQGLWDLSSPSRN